MKNKLTTFYIVRHGQTEWNVSKRIQGQLDSPLTEQGLEEARKLAKKLNNVAFDFVFSSDLLRAKRTAEILKLERKLIIMTSKALRERSFGEHHGILATEYRERIEKLLEEYVKLSIEEKWKYKFGNSYESDEEMVARFINFLREIAVVYEGKKVLIVTHGGPMRTFLMKLGFAEFGKLTPGTFRNSGYMVVQSDGVDFFLKKVEGIDPNLLLNN